MASDEQLIRAHFDAWNVRDRPGMVAALAEDVVIQEDQGFQVAAGVSHGHEGAFALWDQLFDVAEDARVEVVSIEELGDGRVLMLGRIHGTMRHSGFTGSTDMAHVWHMQDGKATRVEVFGSHDAGRAAAQASQPK